MQNSKSYSNAGQRPDDKISATTTLSIIQTILLAAILILGLSGKFVSGGTGIGTDELKTVVAQVVKENTPTAAAPAAAPTAAKPAAAPTATAPSQADATKLSEFYKTAYIEGNKQASISVIEFSDIECPFCQRHTNNGTLDTVAKKYGDKLSIAF
jgi:protein-disulfide isomerase